MNLWTFVALLRSGQLAAFTAVGKTTRAYHRVAFLAAGLHSGWLQRLAAGPAPLATLAADFQLASESRDGLETWLQVGVAVGELRSGPNGYAVRGRLARQLLDPRNDAAAAFVEELASLHHALITQTPERLAADRPFTLAEQDARVIARSSRLVELFICEALASVVPTHSPYRLLEIGCGAGAYIRWACQRNPELTAVGVELQGDAAALASENMARWGLNSRVIVEVGDIRRRPPATAFDLATLHQNIYYFPVAERPALLRHVRGFLKPRGRLLLTTECQGRSAAAAVLDLWGAMTGGCGRLPEPSELVAQLEAAGFVGVIARRLMPTESFYGFVGTNQG
jgi:4-hydroxy-2,2'-bipyrrole-5-carbaldehyde O-methyltransferase